MDITAIMNVIGSVGFPIVMCILMFNWTQKLTQQHKEEMDKITQSLNNNTIAITNLTAHLEERESKND